ncbi:MAG: protein kinase [Anaerolineae bacterium]|nr:protein kinase [Anaerolineae bacterium]
MSKIDTMVIGQYRILEHVGQGGMATVYKAYHPRLDRLVAIKMIHRHFLDDANFVARFEREAQIVARLEHPNIVPVYDFAEYDGQPYIVMKFIEGAPLKDALDEGPIPVADALHVMTHVASALDYAHSKGVLHRDIKPSNIMLDMQTTPYLTDFGLARIVTGGATTLSADMLIGTPYYMSPEQGRGEETVDHRADIYSLGIVLYELLTGTVPYRSGTPYAIINQHITEPLKPPRDYNPDIPPAVEAVILRATAKNREDRYNSAGEMLAALRQSLGAEDMPSLPDAHPLTQSVLIASHARPARPVTNLPSTASAPAIPAPIQTADHAQTLPRQPVKARRGLLPTVLMAIGALVVVLLVLTVVTRIIRNNRADEITPTLATLPTLAAEPTTIAAPANTYTTADGLTLFIVPELSLEDARALVQAEPQNPAAYLSVVRALALMNDLAATEPLLTTGATYAEDTIMYILSAAVALHEADRDWLALVILRDSLTRLQDAPNFDDLREYGGRSLYEAALSDRGVELYQLATLRDLRDLTDERLHSTSPIYQALAARALLTIDRTALANRLVETALNRSPGLAEAQLVLGEIQASVGNLNEARLQWTAARDGSSSPEWVKARARQLLEENVGVASADPTATSSTMPVTNVTSTQPEFAPPPTLAAGQRSPTLRPGETPRFPPPRPGQP